MIPFKKILCPTDFSDASYESLSVANELSLHFSSKLIVLNVVPKVPTVYVQPPMTPVPPEPFNIMQYERDMKKSSKEMLDRIIDKEVSNEVDVNPVVVPGNAAGEIIRIADLEKVDLIVISTHGSSGWKRFIFGSVTEKVVRTANCPVLTIHPTNTVD